MPGALPLRRRLPQTICLSNNASLTRWYGTSNGGNGRRSAHGAKSRGEAGGPSKAKGPVKKGNSGSPMTESDSTVEKEGKAASLYEQLFGRREQERDGNHAPDRELPRIPLEQPAEIQRSGYKVGVRLAPKSAYETQMERSGADGNKEISVLVLRNTSKNLVEDDFRRLIPQTSNIDGWAMERDDILKVVPGRDMTTLERLNFYYVLFSNPLSAFTYQGHASRVHRLVASHTPSSVLSPMMPPPGYQLNNIDANAAIQSFSLVAPNDTLDLRQLKPPLTPFMRALVRYQGYPRIVSRKGRLPYEARLTLDGPQVHLSRIQYVLAIHGRKRGLSWSGSDELRPHIVKWIPSDKEPSSMSSNREAAEWERRHEYQDPGSSTIDLNQAGADALQDDLEASSADVRSRSRHPVYIVGFPTDRALRSFVHYWHRRPLEIDNQSSGAAWPELPPIVNVEALW